MKSFLRAEERDGSFVHWKSIAHELLSGDVEDRYEVEKTVRGTSGRTERLQMQFRFWTTVLGPDDVT